MADEKPEGEYGSDAAAGYADPGFQTDKQPRYPLKEDGKWSQPRIRAAWSYIHHQDNADKYSKAGADKIKDNIKQAAEKHGVHLEEQGD